MEEIARVYSEALFDAAIDAEKLDQVHEQLGQVTDAIDGTRDLQLFFFSPYLSSEDKREGIDGLLEGAEPELQNFLELLCEKHRMPAIFRIRRRFDELWAAHNQKLEVIVTSAVELDESVVNKVGDEIAERTGQEIELTSEVDPDLIGGLKLRVGNRVLDASIQNRLEKLRREVAQG
ncbi:MAG: ATP synthase F1 subunit delta [Solirubrobacterales bacterium]|jgi:ATP synthase F1 delta subunit